MKIRDIVEAFRSAKPAELQEAAPILRDALAVAERPPDASEHELMLAEERRALGAEYKRRQTELTKARDTANARVAVIERERAALEERAQAAYQEQFDVDLVLAAGLRSWCDEIGRLLWEGRPPLVNRLITKLRAEAVIVPDEYYRTHTMVRGHLHDEVSISNEPSCSRRTRALVQLAEKVEAWTRTAAYATEAELREMFAAAYAALPQIAALEPHVRAVPGETAARAAKFRRSAPAAFTDLPPAA